MGKGRSNGPSGVRGPGGPPKRRPTSPARQPSDAQATFYRLSAPGIKVLHRLPRWIPAVVPGIMLFLGLVLTGPLAWLGALLLFLVLSFLLWLLALSWPRLTTGSRVGRLAVIIGLFGLVVLKVVGRL